MRSLKLSFAAAVLLGSTALATPALAGGNNNGPTNNCNGNGSCATNNYDNDTYNTTNKGGTGIGVGVGVGVGVGYGGEGGKGGQGGRGGDGGDAVNFNANIAKGGKAINKNNLNDNLNGNLNDNLNNNLSNNKLTNRQHQDQEQYQGQYQHQSVKNSGNSRNTNNNDNSNSNNADQDVDVNTYNERAPVNTAYAAPLAAGEDTCMGSSSLGAQAVSFGVSIGTTWQDDNCRRLKNSRQLVALGFHRAATALMCVDEDVRAAMVAAGTPCPSGQQTAVVAPPVVYTQTTQYVPMAPIADEPVKKKRRARKALPPK